MSLQQSSRPANRTNALFDFPTSLAPDGFRICLGIAAFIFAWLLQVWPLQTLAFDGPATWGVAAVCAGLAFWFAETLLTLFVISLPLALFTAAAIGIVRG